MPKPAGPDFWQCTKISPISAGFCRISCWNLRFFPGRGGATPGWRHPGVALARAALPRPLWKKTGHQHRIMQNRPFSCRFSRAAAVAAAHGATPGGASRGRQGDGMEAQLEQLDRKLRHVQGRLTKITRDYRALEKLVRDLQVRQDRVEQAARAWMEDEVADWT